MGQSIGTRVFILAAGCSAKYGYLLGNALADQLKKFYRDIPNECARIKQSVSNTVNLMNGLSALETLDQLAKHLEEKLAAWDRTTGSSDDYSNKEKQTDDQILNAKIATSAMFSVKEEKARETNFHGYKRLLDSVFGGEPWQEAVAQSDCRVLTFNYDRLIEIAFLDCFKNFPWQKHSVYDESALNSGFSFNDFDNSGYKRVQPAAGRFCFLKLHGSADWFVKKRKGNRSDQEDELRLYWPRNPNPSVNLHELENLLKRGWDPLIAFPHEKQRASSRETEFSWDPYLRKIEAHAVAVLEGATELRIVGYSFAPIDSRHVIDNLLSRVPRDAKIIVQNTDVATVQSRVEAYPMLRGRVEFDPTPF